MNPKLGEAKPCTRLSIPWRELAIAASALDRARDLTHPLYRYPGSMSPVLARALILGLTSQGETVLDPFCGGGTTAIEALAHGRDAVCSDLNTLACFVTRAKASQMSRLAICSFEQWVDHVRTLLRRKPNGQSIPLVVGKGRNYAPRTYGLVMRLRDSALRLSDPSARRLALLVVLRVAQLCFDCRSRAISPGFAIRAFDTVASQTVAKMREYTERCEGNASQLGLRSRLRVIQCDAADLVAKLGATKPNISLVLTSPPYPGVHMLYHRWQIRGRRETALPYELIGKSDGLYESDYTLGSRHQANNDNYFQRLGDIFSRLRTILNPDTMVAQVVAFSYPEHQLTRFQETMFSAGYDEILNSDTSQSVITRIIPNRRWYALLPTNQNCAREYLVMHRPRLDHG